MQRDGGYQTHCNKKTGAELRAMCLRFWPPRSGRHFWFDLLPEGADGYGTGGVHEVMCSEELPKLQDFFNCGYSFIMLRSHWLLPCIGHTYVDLSRYPLLHMLEQGWFAKSNMYIIIPITIDEQSESLTLTHRFGLFSNLETVNLR